MDITKYEHIQLTGIKGVAMTAIALCLKDLGIKVTGSDTDEVFVSDETLKKAGIAWKIGFGVRNLDPRPDLLITTAAHGGLNNPEVISAKEIGIPVITYAEALASLANSKKLISVCGVGGKGSTSSMIATIMELSGHISSFAIGMGNIFPIDTSGKYNQNSEYFICEADEYAISPGVNDNPKFSILNPYITVVTNIEHDHPDIYPTFEDTIKVYKEFFSRIPKDGFLIACIDNKNTKDAVKLLTGNIETYGFDTEANWNISERTFNEGITQFSISNNGSKYNLTLTVPGDFNVLNATGAFIASVKAGVKPEDVINSLGKFKGARRRFEKMGENDGVLYYDDYAHHPSEVHEALKAAKDWYPKRRIVAVFQPHTFSRTKTLLTDFSKAFSEAGLVGFMDIYASARESKDDSVNSEILAKKTMQYNSNSVYVGNHTKTLEWLKTNVKKGDVVLTMGAGDIFHLYNDLILNN